MLSPFFIALAESHMATDAHMDPEINPIRMLSLGPIKKKTEPIQRRNFTI